MDFSERTALVVGGTSGIGLAIVRALVSHGCRRVVATSEKASAVKEVYEELQDAGVSSVEFVCDATSLSSVRDLIDRVDRLFGRLDLLVNCQGTHRKMRSEDLSDDLFAQIMDVNVLSVFRVIRESYSLLKEAKGSIVNIASMGSFIGLSDAAAYTASKGAISQLTKSLAVEWAKDGIRCNAVAPGWVLTPMSEAALSDPKYREPIERRIPMGRVGVPEDIAHAVLFLASDYARYCTGTILPIDGGALSSV